VSLHSLLDADFYREGARVTPAPRRRIQRRARRKLTPAPWLVPVTPDVRRRALVIQREWQRVDPRYLDGDEQEMWATIAGRQLRFDERQAFVEKLTERGASKRALEVFLSTCAAQNPNRRLRLIALSDRVSMRIERADFDDLVTLVTQAPPWEKDRASGVRIVLRAIAEGKPETVPEQILARWTWRLARAVRKTLDRKASHEFPEAKRLLGALANSRGHRHEENAARLVAAALTSPREVGAALLASAEAYTPRATKMLDEARERLGTVEEIADALAANLPQPKTGPSRSRRRRRKKKKAVAQQVERVQVAAEVPAPPEEAQRAEPAKGEPAEGEPAEGEPAAAEEVPAAAGEAAPVEEKPKRRRRRRKPAADEEAPASPEADASAPAETAAAEEPKPRRTRRKPVAAVADPAAEGPPAAEPPADEAA